jgi:hypothetical protein
MEVVNELGVEDVAIIGIAKGPTTAATGARSSTSPMVARRCCR